MTTEPRDHLLEYALRRVLSEDTSAQAPAGAPPEDLTEQILAAWERGERGSATVEQLGREVREPELRPIRTTPPARPNWRLAASLLVGLSLGAAWWQLGLPGARPAESARLDGPHGPPDRASVARAEPFAVASGPLLVVGDLAVPASRLPAPDVRLTVPGNEPVSIALAGGYLELSPGSIFTLNAEEPGLRMEFGELHASGFAQPFRTDFGFGVARLRPGSSINLRLEPDAKDLLELPVARRRSAARDTLLEGRALRQRLELDVRAGQVALEFEDETMFLREPDAYMVLGPPYLTGPTGPTDPTGESGSIAQLDRAWLTETLAVIGEREFIDYGAKTKALGRNLAPALAREANAELNAYLRTSPSGWTLLQSLLIATTDQTPDRSGALLGFLARSSSPRALRVARSLWTRAPESFTEDHLIAFAEAGEAVFASEVRARVVVGLEHPAPELPTLKSAAHLARGSDDTGRTVLRAALPARGAAPAPGSSLEEEYLAARSLELLGERAPWREFADRWAREALQALESMDPANPGDGAPVRRARWIAGVLALHREPAASLPSWSTKTLWEDSADAWDGGSDALRSELEAQLLR